jgi:hypothetical protein
VRAEEARAAARGADPAALRSKRAQLDVAFAAVMGDLKGATVQVCLPLDTLP